MKKILLGLLAVSAIAMGTTTAKEDGSASVRIETKAFIVSSGLIITDGTNGIDAVELNHGYVLETDKNKKTQTKDIYIKKINGTGFFGGSEIEVTLAPLVPSVTANLKHSTSDAEIQHTLSANLRPVTGASLKKKINISIGGDVTSSTDTVVITSDISAIPFQLISSFTLPSGNIAEGEYANTATLTVKYSKVLGNVQQSEAR